MATLSLCMIVKNEELTLSRCLNSITNVVDEIIIVDTGSSDNTKAIAKQYTNKVYDFIWCNDFSRARNYAFSLATSDYLMWLDADDVVPKSTQNKIRELKKNLNADVYMFKYDIGFINNKPSLSYFRERIIKNCPNAIWQGAVHECIAPFGIVEKIHNSIQHKKERHWNSCRNINIYENILKSRELNPRELYYYGRELFDHCRYLEAIVKFREFVTRGDGWIENNIDALYLSAICYKKINQNNNAIDCLFKTFEYDIPRANVCCQIGDIFMENKKYEEAIYWYKVATKLKDITHKGGFVERKYYNYYPFLQLCCCYFYLNNIDKAIYYNEKAGKIEKNSKIVANNRLFFKKNR